MSDIDVIAHSFMEEINSATSLDELKDIEGRALGKKRGTIELLVRSIGKMTDEERREKSPKYNGWRGAINGAIVGKKKNLDDQAIENRLERERLDLTLPVAPGPTGTIHPVSQVMDELAEIFADLGFAVADGPEIEDDWHNFTALNIPETHPARAMHDTFYMAQGEHVAGNETSHPQPLPEGRGPPRGTVLRHLLRTHTSPVQIRTMRSTPPPIRIIAPGRTYRSDSDATHTPMFHQVEGLVIDRGIHMGHLKWTLETFVKAFFEVDDVTLRLRPSYFPFTEPSVEVDVGCSWAGGTLSIGGTESWLEILGSGMVHPRVIAACGLDPDEWQGFAFGCGIDRLAMLKYGMTDLRAFFDGDARWLRHYGFKATDVPTLSGGVGA